MNLNTIDNYEQRKPFFELTILKCPNCKTSWSADYTDYAWMREEDLIICSCGSVMCEVNDLKDN